MTVNVKEARRKFSQLVDSAQSGTPVTITRRGKKVAKLTSASSTKSGGLPDLTAFRASLKADRKIKTATIQHLRNSERA
jgi:prevent-host-death family protein